METMKLILGVTLAVAGVICLFLSSCQYWALQSEVNDRLTADEKFEPTFWSFATHLEFRRIRQRVLPESPRPRKAWSLAFAGFALFFLGVALAIASLR